MKRILALAVLLLTLLMAANSIADDLTNGLVAYYPFNGNANDASGNGNNGTVFGATLTSDRFNNANSAYNFDGLNDFIAIPEMLYSSIPSFSISAWVKPVDVSNPLEAVVHIGSIQGQSLLGVNSGLPSMNSKLSNGLWYTAITNSQLNTNEYTNLIASYYKGDRIEIWVNGILKNSTPIPNYDLFIERFHYSSIGDVNFVGNVEYPWKGAIDDVRIYNRALSPSEIGQIAAQTAYQLLISKWNYVGNGNWGEASKWSSGTVPSAFNHQAVIDGNPSGTVSLNTNVSLNSLTVSQYNNLAITDGGSISLKKFNDNSPVVSNDGTIKLSTTPNMSSYASLIADGADATFKGNGNVVLDGGGQSSISSINGGRWINDTTHTITGTGQINGPLENRGTLIASNGTLTINGLVTGNGNVQINDGATLSVQNNLQTGNFTMNTYSWLTVANEKYIDVLKNFTFSQKDETQWNWGGSSYLKMDGGISQTLEIGGQDKGAITGGFSNNFNLSGLNISGTGTKITLTDNIDNGNRSKAEALYINNLNVGTGTTLDLNGLKLYTMKDGQAQLVKVGDDFGGGGITDSKALSTVFSPEIINKTLSPIQPTLPNLDPKSWDPTIFKAGNTFDSHYALSVKNGEVVIDLNINLIGDPGDALKNAWKNGIEGIWSNKYNIKDGTNTYPIIVHANFGDINTPNTPYTYTVTVHSGSGRDDVLNWYTGYPLKDQEQVAAHEAGHMMGLYDEYLWGYIIINGVKVPILPGGALDPTLDNLTILQRSMEHVLMTDNSPVVVDRYFEDILKILEDGSGIPLDLLSANAPLYPGDPIPGFADGPPSNVPLPPSLILLGSGLLGLAGWRRFRD